MKSRLFKLTFFLLLGAIVNVAFCWIFATRPMSPTTLRNGPYKFGYSDLGKGVTWTTLTYNSFGRVRLHSSWSYNASPRVNVPYWPPANELVPDWAKEIDNIQPSEINRGNIYAEATGWPFLAMLAHYELGDSIKDASGKSYLPNLNRNGIVISETYGIAPQILPLQPIWPGFAINTIFYSAILWTLTLGPFTARRMIRRKRGRCIKCGYDLRGTSGGGCPECG